MSKKFEVGDKLIVLIPDQEEPATAKFVHENKSGTIRVQLDNGSKITVPREDIFESEGNLKEVMQSPRKKSPGRSKARGRSPGRPRSKSPARKKSPGRKPATPKSPPSKESPKPVTSPRRRAAVKVEESVKKETPVMSLRLRKWEPTPPIKSKMEDTVDSDGEGPAKATPKKSSTEYGGVFGITCMLVLGVTMVLTSHLLLRSANNSVAGLKPNQSDLILPKVKANLDIRKLDFVGLYRHFPKFDLLAAEIYFGFLIIQVLLSLLPIGRLEQAIPGTPGPSFFRCNGIYNAILTLSTICVLHIYFNIGLTYKQLLEMIPQWMVMGIASAVVLAAVCCYRASRLPLSQQNPKLADTGRIYNFFMGKEISPSFGILNLKATLVKTCCITALALQLALYFALDNTQRTPTLMLAMGMMCFYIADTLLFERNFYVTYGYNNEGLGLMILFMVLIYPFENILTTLYLSVSRFEISMYACAGLLTFYLIGYLVYRTSNNEKSEFRRNPLNPIFANAETIPTSRGKRLLCSNWWGFVRHPNYLGDILMHLCLIPLAGLHPIACILPVMTILELLCRAHRDSNHCKAKYGDAWARYCEKVPYKCIPRVY